MPKILIFGLATVGALLLSAGAGFATAPKLDDDTCTQLRAEQTKFQQSGLLDDLAKGAEWAKANLSPDRLREIEHYMTLDEQVKFGCRDAKLSRDAERAREAAGRLEINSDADPTAPAASDTPVSNPKKKQRGHVKAEADPEPAATKTAKPKKAAKAPKARDDAKNSAPAEPVAPPVIIVEDPAKPPQRPSDP